MMQKLQLDFCASRRTAPWVGLVLLAAAVLVAADAGLSYRAAQQALAENQLRIAKRSATPAVLRISSQEIAAVRETVQRLSLRWDDLFAALEAAADERVTLAAIEPDTKSGTVKISGDGKDYLAALSYVFNLSRSESLDRVQLVHHEQKADDPNGAVSFAVSAAWSPRQ